MAGTRQKLEQGLIDRAWNDIVSGAWKLILASFVLPVGAAIWAYLRDVPAWTIFMLAWPAILVGILASMLIVGIYRTVFSARAKLEIQYDRRRDFITSPNGCREARFVVKNVSKKNAAHVIFVRIEDLIAISRDSAHPQASQFRNVQMHIERGDQGMTLQPHEYVEVFGPKMALNGSDLYFRSKEVYAGKDGYHTVSHDRYRLDVIVTAQNSDPVRQSFLICKNADGLMEFEAVGDDS